MIAVYCMYTKPDIWLKNEKFSWISQIPPPSLHGHDPLMVRTAAPIITQYYLEPGGEHMDFPPLGLINSLP
jgi:hypothetical protein